MIRINPSGEVIDDFHPNFLPYPRIPSITNIIPRPTRTVGRSHRVNVISSTKVKTPIYHFSSIISLTRLWLLSLPSVYGTPSIFHAIFCLSPVCFMCGWHTGLFEGFVVGVGTVEGADLWNVIYYSKGGG